MCRYLPAESARSIEALLEQQVMATKLAEHIVQKLIAVSVVEEGDRELYIYGFFLLITRFYFFLVTIAFGCFLRIPCESVIFYIVFILLRSYAGGVHARTEMACTVWTTLTIGIAMVAIKMMEVLNGPILIFAVFSDLCILIHSPLDSEAKCLDANERRKFRRICYWLLFICNAVIIGAFFIALPVLYYSVVCGMFTEAILLGIGKYLAVRNVAPPD